MKAFIVTLVACLMLAFVVSSASGQGRKVEVDCSNSTITTPFNSIALHVTGGVGLSCNKSQWPTAIVSYKIHYIKLMQRHPNGGPWIQKGPTYRTGKKVLTVLRVAPMVSYATEFIERRCRPARRGWYYQTWADFTVYADDPTGRAVPNRYRTGLLPSEISEIRCR